MNVAMLVVTRAVAARLGERPSGNTSGRASTSTSHAEAAGRRAQHPDHGVRRRLGVLGEAGQTDGDQSLADAPGSAAERA